MAPVDRVFFQFLQAPTRARAKIREFLQFLQAPTRARLNYAPVGNFQASGLWCVRMPDRMPTSMARASTGEIPSPSMPAVAFSMWMGFCP